MQDNAKFCVNPHTLLPAQYVERLSLKMNEVDATVDKGEIVIVEGMLAVAIIACKHWSAVGGQVSKLAIIAKPQVKKSLLLKSLARTTLVAPKV